MEPMELMTPATSKTPLTDAHQEAFNERIGFGLGDIILAYDHARELEERLAEARAEIDNLKRSHAAIYLALGGDSDAAMWPAIITELKAEVKRLKKALFLEEENRNELAILGYRTETAERALLAEEAAHITDVAHEIDRREAAEEALLDFVSLAERRLADGDGELECMVEKHQSAIDAAKGEAS